MAAIKVVIKTTVIKIKEKNNIHVINISLLSSNSNPRPA